MLAVKTLTAEDVREIVIHQLAQIAPEADFAALDAQEDLRRALDIDSFDFLNLMIALDQQLSVAIPEADAGRLSSLDDIVGYLMTHLPTPAEEGTSYGA
jgi:acyl carrier protein